MTDNTRDKPNVVISKYSRQRYLAELRTRFPALGKGEIPVQVIIDHLRRRSEFSGVRLTDIRKELCCCANEFRWQQIAQKLIDDMTSKTHLEDIYSEAKKLLGSLARLNTRHAGELQRALLKSILNDEPRINIGILIHSLEVLIHECDDLNKRTPAELKLRGRPARRHVDEAARTLRSIWTQTLRQEFNFSFATGLGPHREKEFASPGCLFVQLILQEFDPSLKISAVRTSLEKMQPS